MGKKLDALLGRTFKTSRFKSLLNLAVSRVAVLKNQRQVRASHARSDVVQLLDLDQHQRALLRVEHVIQEQNMLDAFLMIEGYCLQLIERINLLEQQKACPEELKEGVASLIYAASRCGEFPELQEIRAVFAARFGKEFVLRSIELRNNCGVNPRMIQKLSIRQPSLENRLKLLEEIASQNGTALKLEEASFASTVDHNLPMKQEPNQPKQGNSVTSGHGISSDLLVLPEEIRKVEQFSSSMKQRKYRGVADAAQAAFESAAYAAAAARAAVELSRSEPHNPDDQTGPNAGLGEVSDINKPVESRHDTVNNRDLGEVENVNVGLGFRKIHPIEAYHSESEEDELQNSNQAQDFQLRKSAAKLKRSKSIPSSDLEKDIDFDESDNESEAIASTSHEHMPLRGQTHRSGGSKMERPLVINLDKRPISVRTRR